MHAQYISNRGILAPWARIMSRSPFQLRDQSKSRTSRMPKRSNSSPACQRDEAIVFDNLFKITAQCQAVGEGKAERPRPKRQRSLHSLKSASLGLMRKLKDKFGSQSISVLPEPSSPRSHHSQQGSNIDRMQQQLILDRGMDQARTRVRAQLAAQHEQRVAKRPNINYFRKPCETEDAQPDQRNACPQQRKHRPLNPNLHHYLSQDLLQAVG